MKRGEKEGKDHVEEMEDEDVPEGWDKEDDEKTEKPAVKSEPGDDENGDCRENQKE